MTRIGVLGAPGTGKSRLCEELDEHFRDRGRHVDNVRGSDAGG